MKSKKKENTSPRKQLTVGELIKALNRIDPAAKVVIGYDYDGRQTCSEAVSVLAEIDREETVIIADKWY